MSWKTKSLWIFAMLLMSYAFWIFVGLLVLTPKVDTINAMTGWKPASVILCTYELTTWPKVLCDIHNWEADELLDEGD